MGLRGGLMLWRMIKRSRNYYVGFMLDVESEDSRFPMAFHCIKLDRTMILMYNTRLPRCGSMDHLMRM